MLRSSSRGPLEGHSHTRVVWLDGRTVPGDTAALSIDDPGARWGEGLFETMRAEGGRVALLDRHLARLRASATTLGLDPMPSEDEMRTGVAGALAAFGPGPARVRLTATPRPTLLVEVTAAEPFGDGPPAGRAITVPGAWMPENRLAEHKSLSYAAHRLSQRRADAAGADHALLLDRDGRLGEAAVASVFCAVSDGVVTAPVTGLLPGIARGVGLAATGAREEALAEAAWRGAREIVTVNAVRGAMAIVQIDGARVGDGRPGPLARDLFAALRAATA
jgi:branched-chain amino acid aminotransferase